MADKKIKLVNKNKAVPREEKPKVKFVMKPRVEKREFPFSDADFAVLADLIQSRTGIVMKDHKKNMVYSRLARRLRKLGLASFGDYLHYLSGRHGEQEISHLFNAITTNLTQFFRESHHFDHFRTTVLPEAMGEMRVKKSNRFRVWSAGCSSGEEPYSIAMVMDRFFKQHGVDDVDARILATDLDTQMLETGRVGNYLTKEVEKIPADYTSYLTTNLVSADMVHISNELRKCIAFKTLNLLNDWPVKGPFDAIFCRNVMIYFDAETKAQMTNRFTELLKPGGWLYLGHSETLLDASGRLELLGRSIYRRKSD